MKQVLKHHVLKKFNYYIVSLTQANANSLHYLLQDLQPLIRRQIKHARIQNMANNLLNIPIRLFFNHFKINSFLKVTHTSKRSNDDQCNFILKKDQT